MRQRYAGEDNQGPCRRVWSRVGQHGDELDAFNGNMRRRNFEGLGARIETLYGVKRLGL